MMRNLRTAVLSAISVAVLTVATVQPVVAEPAVTPDVHEQLTLMGASDATVSSGPVWSLTPTGYASTPSESLPNGTTGGTGGSLVTVDTQAELAVAVADTEPRIVLVDGRIDLAPFGTMIRVGSNKTIVGARDRAELVAGGLFLNGSHNVIIRNLTIRDSYVPGDWDGKTKDNDGVRMDTADHVWVDHCTFARTGDGLVDVRKDSTEVTLSWNVFRDHNKAIGVGWTENFLTRITFHHNEFVNTYQRNASTDRVVGGHFYNNWLHDIGLYGLMVRGGAQFLAESNYFQDMEDPLVEKDDISTIRSRNNVFRNTRGHRDSTGNTVNPSSSYPYTVDPAVDVPRIVGDYAGALLKPSPPETVTVALDGTGDYGSVSAALGAARDRQAPTTIVIKPGVYYEIVRLWGDLTDVTLKGATGDPKDIVITNNVAAGTEKFYGGLYGGSGSPTVTILSNDVTLSDLTIENSYDEAANGPSQALALRTTGDRIKLDHVRLLGNQDTFLADTPSLDARSRVYVHDSEIVGDVDFIFGRATAVFEGSTIRSVDRGRPANGYVTAASTVADNPYGFLFVGCQFVSDAAAGTVTLGRPWHPGNAPGVNPSVVVRNSYLGAHIGKPAWTDMSGWSWRDARFAEFENHGPGAATGDGRPQLDPTQVRLHAPGTYLSGPDNWTPNK